MNWSENDRGAALIHVAGALLALMAFSTFVMDYGVYWSARRQAQNAADAAALAGAVALAYDDSLDKTTTGPAVESAQAEVQRNLVFGQQASVVPATDITFPTCPDGSTTCIRVDVYRTTARGNALPVFFGLFAKVGVSGNALTSQDVKATATAEVAIANTATCMRPFALPDKWIGTADQPFDPATDTYIPPSQTGATGYNLATDNGTEVLLKGDSKDPPRLASGWFMLLDVGSGGASVRDQIAKCSNNVDWTIGTDLPNEQGGTVGPVNQGVGDLLSLNGGSPATWNSSTKTIDNNCVLTHSCYAYDSQGNRVADPSATLNPQIVPIPVFDPKIQQATGELVMVNVLGFFIEAMQNNKDVQGVFVTLPGKYAASTMSPPLGTAAFLKSIQLVR